MIIHSIKAYLKREKYIWNNNKTTIELVNYKTLVLLCSILSIGAFILACVATFLPSFNAMRLPYYFLLMVFSPLLVYIIRNKNIDSLLLLYITNTLVLMLVVYTAVIVVPDNLSTLILGFVFIFPLTVFDRTYRITLVMLMFVAIYIIFATPYKASDIVVMDTVNVIGFSVVANILGAHLRQLQLENIDLRRLSRISATTDSLTGLNNRTKLQDTIKHIDLERDVQAVLMLDIDYFKVYNDTYGHQAGDECLKRLAECLMDLSKLYDVEFYRYGGEEFLGIIWKEENDSPYDISKQIAKQVRILNIKHDKSPFKRLTISMGCALNHEGANNTIDSLIGQADSALYYSKNNGRNQFNFKNRVD